MVTIWHSATIRCANSLLPASGRYIASILVVPMKANCRWRWIHARRQKHLKKRYFTSSVFRRLNSQQPEVAEQLWKDAAADLQKRYDFLAQMAGKAEKSNTD